MLTIHQIRSDPGRLTQSNSRPHSHKDLFEPFRLLSDNYPGNNPNLLHDLTILAYERYTKRRPIDALRVFLFQLLLRRRELYRLWGMVEAQDDAEKWGPNVRAQYLTFCRETEEDLR